jgi:7,8-dihydropterin-6-yl-methyl-4-(beta-D-ribofuranosyl)aminobenzene 5'-phosphate synthase
MVKKILQGILITGLVMVAVIFAFAAARFGLEIGKPEMAAPAQMSLVELGSTQSLTVMPLYEFDLTDDRLSGGHGVAYQITTDQSNLLLDFGYNETNTYPSPLEDNMNLLGVSISDFDTIVLSHDHPDHVGSMGNWLSNTFSVGRQADDLRGMAVYVPVKMEHPTAQLTVVDQPAKIAEGVATLGPMYFDFSFPFNVIKKWHYEQPLVVNVEGVGLILITGCGHPGVEQMAARAEQIFGQPVVGMIGGLHGVGLAPDEVAADIAYIKALNPVVVAVSPHDSLPEQVEQYGNAFGSVYQYLSLGETISLGNPK